MLRSLVSLLCIASLVGCSTTSTVSGGLSSGLPEARERSDGTVRMVDDHNRTIHLRPDDRLEVTTVDGATTKLRGDEICRSEDGMSVRRAGEPCSSSVWLAGWEEIGEIKVEQFDGATSVAATAVVAIIVVGAIIIAMSDKGKSSSKSGSSSSPPPASGSGLVGGMTGGGAAPARHARRGPRGGGGGFGPVFIFIPGSSTSSSYEGGGRGPLPPPPGAAHDPTAVPLFSGRAIRQAVVRPSLRADVTGCVGGTPCVGGSLRLGVLLGDLVELSGGARVEQLRDRTQPYGLVGLGFQGRFPTVPSLAMYLGSQVAIGSEFRIMPSVGLRWQPATHLWLGFNPIGVTFFLDEHRVSYTPSLDVAVEF